jgi:hypothetical protein
MPLCLTYVVFDPQEDKEKMLEEARAIEAEAARLSEAAALRASEAQAAAVAKAKALETAQKDQMDQDATSMQVCACLCVVCMHMCLSVCAYVHVCDTKSGCILHSLILPMLRMRAFYFNYVPF